MLGISLDITDRKMAEERLQLALDEAARLRDQLQHRNGHLREITTPAAPAQIVGRSPAMRRALAQVEQVAATDVDRAPARRDRHRQRSCSRARSHALSPRRAAPHGRVELRGDPARPHRERALRPRERRLHRRAARAIGRFELADGGTLFLDEIGELPLDVAGQAAARPRRSARSSGWAAPARSRWTCALIAATNRDLGGAGAGRHVPRGPVLPPQRLPHHRPAAARAPRGHPAPREGDRRGTVRDDGEARRRNPARADERARRYPWPGNVRELRNAVERAMITATGPTLTLSVPAGAHPSRSAGQTLHDVERTTCSPCCSRPVGESAARGVRRPSLGLPAHDPREPDEKAGDHSTRLEQRAVVNPRIREAPRRVRPRTRPSGVATIAVEQVPSLRAPAPAVAKRMLFALRGAVAGSLDRRTGSGPGHAPGALEGQGRRTTRSDFQPTSASTPTNRTPWSTSRSGDDTIGSHTEFNRPASDSLLGVLETSIAAPALEVRDVACIGASITWRGSGRRRRAAPVDTRCAADVPAASPGREARNERARANERRATDLTRAGIRGGHMVNGRVSRDGLAGRIHEQRWRRVRGERRGDHDER